MSIERHPNIHIVSFMMIITEALVDSLRGKAEHLQGSILNATLPIIKEFVEKIDETIDDVVENKK